jgi:hypothetical protein
MSDKKFDPVKNAHKTNDGILLLFIRVNRTRIKTYLFDVYLLFFI